MVQSSKFIAGGIMRKVAVFLLTIVFLFFPVAGNTAYLIKLKNGKEFVTSRYWQEGKQIMFYAYGGVLGVEKNLVVKIEETERTAAPVPSSPVVSPPQPEAPDEPTNGSAGEKVKPDKEGKTASAPKKELKKDEEVLKEFQLLQQRFSRLNDLTTLEVYALSSDIDTFKRKLEGSNLAEAHKDEIAAAATLMRAIEGYLKATMR